MNNFSFKIYNTPSVFAVAKPAPSVRELKYKLFTFMNIKNKGL